MRNAVKESIAQLFKDGMDKIGFNLEILVLKQKLITEEDTFRYCQQIEDCLKNSKNVYIDITHGFRSMPMVAYTALSALRESYNLKIAGIYYGALNDDLCDKTDVENKFVGKIIVLKRGIKELASRADKAKARECLSELDKLFNSYKPINVQGTILEMNLLDSLTKNSMAIAKYTQDSNLEHLIPLFENNNIPQHEQLVAHLKQGALYENLSFMDSSISELKQFSILYGNVKDNHPVMELISEELDDRLALLDLEDEENGKKRVLYLVEKAWICMPDVQRSSCNLYEAMQTVAYCIRKRVIEAYKEVSIKEDPISACANNLKDSNILLPKKYLKELLVAFAKEPKIDTKKNNPEANDKVIRKLLKKFPNTIDYWFTLRNIRNIVHIERDYNDKDIKKYPEILNSLSRIINDDNNYL